jgi:hypothetical protein
MEAEDQRIFAILDEYANKGHSFVNIITHGKTRYVQSCIKCGLRVRIKHQIKGKTRNLSRCPISIIESIMET